MRLCVYLLAILLSCSRVPTVHADDGDKTASVEASDRFRRGVSLYREGAFRAALLEFERAYAIQPNYRLLYNIGETHLQLGEYLSASNDLERYLQEGGPEVSPERRDEVERKLTRLRERIALISVSVDRKDAEIFIDDNSVGMSPLAKGVTVNVGRHRVSVRGADGAIASEVVDVAGGDIREVSLKLGDEVVKSPVVQTAEVPPPAEAKKSKPRTLYSKIALGCLVGAGAFTVGTVVAAVIQRNKFSAYEKAVNTPGVDPNTVVSRNTSGWRAAVATDVLGSVAIAAAAAGATFWFLDRRRESPTAPKLQVGVAADQLLVKGEF